MRVLIACEESQTVCKAFRAKGQKQILPRYSRRNGGTVGIDHFRDLTEMV